MFEKLKDLFFTPEGDSPLETNEDQIAVATLLFEAAASDGVIEDTEQARITALLGKYFALDAAALDTLCTQALKTQQDAIEISRFTRAIKDHFPMEERVSIIEMLWDVAYADGHVDDYEANLMRRIGGLIYVDDKDNGGARKRIAAKHGLS